MRVPLISRLVVVVAACAVVAMGWDHGDKQPRSFTYTAVPYTVGELGDSGTFVSLAGEGHHLFEADTVSVVVAADHEAYFRMRMRQYGFTIVQELHPSAMPETWPPHVPMNPSTSRPPKLIPQDWFTASIRVPAGSSPDAAAVIARVAGVREAAPSPVLTTDVVVVGGG